MIDPHPAPPTTLRSRVLRGLAWKAGSQTLLQIVRFVVALLLARLLAPHDYGLAAMVLVFSGFVVLIADSALGTALIQRRELSDCDRSTVFWTGVAAGAACTAAGAALSGPLAGFYGEPRVRGLFLALSLSFFVTSLGTTHSALLARELDFRALELRQIAATLVGAAVGVSVALGGYGAWAIVLQQLAAGAASTVLLWSFSRWRPSFAFSGSSLRSFGTFGGKLFVQNVLYFVGRNADNVLVGRVLGPAALGVYSLSYNVMLAPFHQIAGPVQQVLFPAFARMQDDRTRMADVWIRVTRLVGAVSLPALAGLVVVAPDFVRVFLGSGWAEASDVIRILAWVGLIQSLQTLNGEILLALDRVGTLLWFTVLWLIASLLAFGIGLRWGIVGVATSYAVAGSIVEPLNAWLTARALGVSVLSFARSLAGVAQAAVGMALGVAALRWLLLAQDVPSVARLCVCVAAGIMLYVPLCVWRAREAVAEVASVMRQRQQVGETTVAPSVAPIRAARLPVRLSAPGRSPGQE